MSNPSLFYYLTSIYGIHRAKALKLCVYIGSSPKTPYQSLNWKKKNTLFKVLNFYFQSKDHDVIGKNLIAFQKNQISKKINSNSLAGRRFKLRLPTRGQRTSTNAKSARRLHHL